MSENQSSYRQIMKATSIFGGVQVFSIIIQLIRSKAIAVFLGPAGMGIMGLLTTTISLIGSATNFGLGTSAVRDISAANNSNDKVKIALTVATLRKLVWMTGLLGMVFTIALSPLLSKMTFGNYDYTLAFVFLSVSLLFSQLASGQSVLLQGLRKLSWLAKSNVYGAVFGLLISLPLYYFFGRHGIVPAIILSALALLVIQYFFAKKVIVENITVSIKDALKEGKGMMRLGFMLSLSGLITLAASYLVRIYISNSGSIADVGLYSAGFAIISVYVGLVFSAMGTDYYPRLAAVSSDNAACKKVINQQAEIALLILLPIILIFLVFINWVVVLLYSAEFSPVKEMILYAAVGMLFKAASWALAFLFLAKADSKLFFLNEFVTNIYLTAFNILGYYYAGLTGLGISFLVSYILYLVQVYLVTKNKYKFKFSSEFVKIFLASILSSTICFLVVTFTSEFYSYIIGTILIILAILFSFKELDKRLQLKELINNKLKK